MAIYHPKKQCHPKPHSLLTNHRSTLYSMLICAALVSQTATHLSRDLRLPMDVPPPAGSAPWPKLLFAYRSLGPVLTWRQSTQKSPSRSRVQLMLLLMM